MVCSGPSGQLRAGRKESQSKRHDEERRHVTCQVTHLSRLGDRLDGHYSCIYGAGPHGEPDQVQIGYPTIHGSYRELIGHPRDQTDEYRKNETKGSTLISILALWASSQGATDNTQALAEFAKEKLAHCNMQLWVPGADSEGKVYLGHSAHGMALTDIPITANGNAAIEVLEAESAQDNHFNALSAISLGHWPILVLACRHHRLPIPPNLWLHLLKEVRSVPNSSENSF
jgi:hypothetical protein